MGLRCMGLRCMGLRGGPVLQGIVIDINDDGLVHTCSLDKSILTFDLRTERRANCHMLREVGLNPRAAPISP